MFRVFHHIRSVSVRRICPVVLPRVLLLSGADLWVGVMDHVRMAADSTMLRMVNRLIALSLGVQRAQLEQRTGLTWPRPFLLRPLNNQSVSRSIFKIQTPGPILSCSAMRFGWSCQFFFSYGVCACVASVGVIAEIMSNGRLCREFVGGNDLTWMPAS